MLSQTIAIVVLKCNKMKRLLPIIVLLIGISCSKPKPEGVILKLKYQPESKYLISTIRGTETVMTYSGQEIAMKKLKSMNIKNPTITKVNTKTETEVVTGKVLKDLSYPISLTYKKTNNLDGGNEVPEKTIVFGTIKNGQIPTFHTIASDILDFDQKTQLMQIVRNSYEQFEFPAKRLKIGEQFSMDHTISIPMEGSVIETVITSTYKLVGSKNGIAQFKISQSYKMSPKMMDNSFQGTGDGNGSITYNLKDSLIVAYSLQTSLEMKKKLDYFEFDLKTSNDFSQTTKIIKD